MVGGEARRRAVIHIENVAAEALLPIRPQVSVGTATYFNRRTRSLPTCAISVDVLTSLDSSKSASYRESVDSASSVAIERSHREQPGPKTSYLRKA